MTTLPSGVPVAPSGTGGTLGELLSQRGAQVGGKPEVCALCLELKPDRLGPSGGKAEEGQMPAAAHTHTADPGEGARPKPSAMSAEAGQSRPSLEEHLLPRSLWAAASLTSVRSGALAAGCDGGGVGLLVALEVSVGAGLVGGTHSGRAVRAHGVPPGLSGPAWLWYQMG